VPSPLPRATLTLPAAPAEHGVDDAVPIDIPGSRVEGWKPSVGWCWVNARLIADAFADLDRPGRRARLAWMHLMAKQRRKTLAICRRYHEDIHAGRATAPTGRDQLEGRVPGNRQAQFGKDRRKQTRPWPPRQRPTSVDGRRWNGAARPTVTG